MIHFDLPKEKSSIIKVIGVGGGGSNAVNHMYGQQIEGVNFIICNTDAQAISLSRVPNKVQLGPHLTQGLGAGANPDIGRQATEESLGEIKTILEVNTKMAFITAGMGGGTGTGGAPIIAKICKDLGILTVGIVTTPFSYEGKKRQVQAEEGILMLKQYVDTLLVISNDKLRHQFGNLKMKEAFAKADNVLATAAKCITDVINSTGQINVDFADVCTVMRNGGVAILGSSTVEGENRAQRAIEEALSSPLLNDNDIRGAKWILININSSGDEHEFTMDEVEVIQNHLLRAAGENTDIILGLGYDHNLGAKIGITIIATGFEYKDPFVRQPMTQVPEQPEEKIVLTLRPVEDAGRNSVKPQEETKIHAAVPVLVEDMAAQTLAANLSPRLHEAEPSSLIQELGFLPKEGSSRISGDEPPEKEDGAIVEWILTPEPLVSRKENNPTVHKETHSPSPIGSGGYLARPSNIYEEEPISNKQSLPEHLPVKEQIVGTAATDPSREAELPTDMQLVFKDDIPAADEPRAHQTQHQFMADIPPAEEPAMQDEAEEQKRRAAERINKLRNLSFNINAAEPNNEFETVPAYIRRNLELYNTISNVENFYSNYQVKTDENNNSEISTINTFLDGKKPD
jgi:cell division protein FtsZ